MKKNVPSHIRSVHKSRGFLNVMVKVLFAVLFVLTAIYGYNMFRDVYGSSRAVEDVNIEIPSGAGINHISEIMKENSIVKHPVVFKMYAKHFAPDAIYQQGTHTLHANMSYAAIIEIISQIPENVLPEGAVRITIPEGFELRQIVDLLEQKELINRDVFMREVNKGNFDYNFIKSIKRTENRMEGYLFPATYDILKGQSEYSIIDQMLKKFSEVVVPLYDESDKKRTLDDIVIMASMVEREARLDEERSIVASVFYNRLDKKMNLGSCATVEYILQERKAILSTKDTQIESKYNTYKYPGLPIGPIASPGEESIKAALNPEKTDYLYFTANADATSHTFSKTLADHDKATRAAQQGGTQ